MPLAKTQNWGIGYLLVSWIHSKAYKSIHLTKMKHIVKAFIIHDIQGLVLSSFCKHWHKYEGQNVIIYLILVLAQGIDFGMQLSGNIAANSSAVSSHEHFDDWQTNFQCPPNFCMNCRGINYHTIYETNIFRCRCEG